jgi:hypothetical protein
MRKRREERNIKGEKRGGGGKREERNREIEKRRAIKLVLLFIYSKLSFSGGRDMAKHASLLCVLLPWSPNSI